jgi:hypothetical protein
MLPILAVCLALRAVLAPVGPAPATAAVPEDPGTVVLPGPPTLQAVVADLDGAGSRDLVRLVRGADASQLLEVWREAGGAWARLGDGVEVVAPEIGRFDAVHAPGPARLLVRTDGARERVAIVRQPSFDPPGLEPECCLEIHDVVPTRDGVELRPVGSAPAAVDAILALDLDGDGVDELLASRSLRPLGRTAYPSEALVFRWDGDRFGPPTLTELPVGSGNTPFVLGETDGVPGQEAGLIATAARSELYRLVLDDGDRIRAERAGIVAESAMAVPLAEGPGVAVVGPIRGLTVHRWPAASELGPELGHRSGTDVRLLGSVAGKGGWSLLVAPGDDVPIETLSLPELAPLDRTLVASAAAMTTLSSTSLRPYRGPLPGGAPDGGPAVIHDGVLSPIRGAPMPVRSLAEAHPVGLLGPARGWLAVATGLGMGAPLDRAGGRLEALGVPASGSVAIVPAELALAPERDGGVLEPELRDAHVLDADGMLGIPPSGFAATVRAPAGSWMFTGVGDGSAYGLQAVPESGQAEVEIPVPRALLPYGGDRVWMAVTTPGGATHVGTWTVLALTAAPPLEARAVTAVIGSSSVEVRGRTAPFVSVTVGGQSVQTMPDGAFVGSVDLPPWPTEVEVLATDPVGNVASLTLVGVGLFDYRGLPLIPITLAALAVLAGVLYVRAPRRAAWAGGEESLEELDPDREL